ncbi:MAG TPA: amino acid adenylation domain-containing protein [Candidatus Acidoferrum sp.]|nr:amino acid adenylation domain-containing protein [Candidatus Acidoferrum sp.]
MNDEQSLDGIAIVGMAGRFPGAETVEKFWANLVAGRESISFFNDEELAASGLDAAELKRRGQYVAARGVLKDADCFDAAFFGVNPKEAQVMDPQQRVFLEACWAALERAGYAPDKMAGSVGVFAGASTNTYVHHALEPRPELMELVGADLVMYGNDKDYLTTRVAYKLGLKGPALNVATACSTSLVAVGQACQSLLMFQCDVALAGGVSVRVPQQRGYYYDEGNIGSPDGHTRTFDATAEGTTFSNGVGVVVLKRLEDAVKDGDQIFAVIKGVGLNNDGSQRVSFGAPGVEGQSEAVAMAQALAGVDPETITYVEAHGTATPLGDPIEVAGLTKAFRMGTQAKQFCAIGSVKSNIGHLDVAAGVAGLIKTALALHHKIIPASLHFTKPNPKLEIEKTPFYVNAALQEWRSKGTAPRRAGISSFGSGGTNAHLVLEEAPRTEFSGPSRPWQLLVLSAKTADALERATQNLCEHLKAIGADGEGLKQHSALADAAFTLQTGRSEFPHRRVMACADAAEGALALETKDPKRVFTHHQKLVDPPVVFMFPGQGAQYAGMGAELYRTEPTFRAEVDRCADLLKAELKTDIREVMFPAEGANKKSDELLKQTRFTQPALFVIEYALAKLWMSWGIKPAAMIGHSVGEYVAGCLAGVFTLEDALTLIVRRAALVQAQPGGAMLAIRLPEKEVLGLLNPQLAIAAINSPNLCVVSGSNEAIGKLEEELSAKKIAARRLQTSHAFHSPMMEPVLAPFTKLLRKAKFGEPQIPYVSNVTAKWITSAEAKSPEYWAGHVRQTVRFAEGVAELMKDSKYVLLEVGPGQTLSTLARQHPSKASEQTVLASLAMTGEQEPHGLLDTLGRLSMNGVSVDWQEFYDNERRLRAVLPTYPFERKRYWPESAPTAARGARLVTQSSSASVAGNGASGNVTPTASTETQAVQPAVVSPQPEAPLEPTLPRKDRLLAASRTLLEELSGYDLSQVDPATSLLEVGLDSLLLTQAAQVFHRKFGVSITFRQLMEELASLQQIAEHLDATLPAEAFAPPAAPTPVAATGTTQQTVAAGDFETGNIPTSILEQILQQQQALTQQVLQLMGRAPSPAATSSPASNPVPAAATTPSTVVKSEVKSHGPFKPIDRAADMAMTAEQTAALKELITRYTKRTAESKKLAIQNRPILADPRSVGGFKQLWKDMVYPIFTTHSDGSKVWDVDGNEYVDFVMGFGASIFGHRPPFVVEAVKKQLDLGFEIGPIQPIAGEVAELVREFTGMQRVAFTNTGSEAVLAATRVARTVTGRDKIAVFAGAYHGIFDEVLFRPLTVNGETRTAASAPGVPASAVSQVIVLDYGNAQSLDILRARGSEIAAVLVEPVQSRRLDLQPREFLHELRKATKETGSALIFDEVVTGFRVEPGGAQAYFGVRADLATYGKVIGGGISIGAVTGDPKYMDALDGGQWNYGDSSFPEVGVTFFAGTFVRHPLALAAAKAVLLHLKEQGPDLQKNLTTRTARLADQLRAIIEEFQAPYQISQFSSLMQLTFPPEQKYAALLHYMLRERGIHMWDNRAFVLTTAHSEADLTKLLTAFRESLQTMVEAGFLPPPSSGSKKSSTVKTHASDTSDKEREIVPVAVSAAGVDQFPLTEAQKEIWLAAQMSAEAALGYNESLKLDFHGSFDPELFRSAVGQIIRRHPILLASFGADGQWQRVNSKIQLKVPLIDLSAKKDAERERELERVMEQEVSEPFDLVVGPLVRVRIVRLSGEHHVVIWTAHHIICDGWSGGLVVSELSTIYSALKQGIQPVLDAPESFREYALASQADSPEVAEAMEYWCEQFADVPAPLDLPADHLRPLVRSARAATLKRVFDPELRQSLKRVAGQQRTTLVVMLMAALDTLFYRITGQTDLVLGLGVAGQAVSGKTCLVGHCVNLLPIRTQIQPNAPFQENLAAVKKRVLDAYDHHQATVGGMLQHIAVPRSAGRPPLVEVVFNVDRDVATAQFSGTEFSCERNPKRALHYDLFFNFVEGPSGLYVECDYNTDLFGAATVERWLNYYQTLLASIVANPAERLSQLALMSESELQKLLSFSNGAESPTFITADLLHEMIERQVLASPKAPAVSFDGRVLSYSELNYRANQLAHHLAGLGVGPNQLVGVCTERSIEMVVALLGILKAGGAYVPLDPAFPQSRLDYMVEDSAMRVLVTHRGLDQKLKVRPPVVVHLDSDEDEIVSCSGDFVGPTHIDPSHLAYVLYTSGSTGRPKGVEIPHSAVVNLLLSMQREPGFTAKNTILAVTTLSFDIAGLELYLPLISGGRLVIASREDVYDPARLAKKMAECQCDVMQATPATWRALIGAGWRGSAKVKVLCGGEAFPPDLARELLSRCAELWNMYGPTETTIWSAIHKVALADGPIPIGRPIANTQIFILDGERNLVPMGSVGELYIGGAGLAQGYLHRPELTQERFIQSPFDPNAKLYKTGDLARHLPTGEIEYLGRIDHQVKIRGFRIELGEVEAVLSKHAGIKQCVVTAREDTPGDKALVAYFEAQGDGALDVSDLRAHLKKEIPEYMVPSAFVRMEKLPLTPNGKIDVKALPAPGQAGVVEAKGAFVAPRDTVEDTLTQLWSKILKVKRISINDDFFELGGHSLLAVRVIMEIEKNYHRRLPLATLLQAPTISGLAEVLRKENWHSSWSSLVPIQPLGTKPPLFLVHGAEGNVLLYRQVASHLGLDQPVYGLQSQGLNAEGNFPTTVRDMAAEYIKEIVALQPHGPYFVGGYCLGGTIAFEIAQQLTDRGQKVEIVIMLDTYNDAAVPTSRTQAILQKPLHLLQNLWFHGANATSIRGEDRKKFLSEKMDIALTRLGIRFRAAQSQLRRLAGHASQNGYAHLMIKRVNDEAAAQYLPRPYAGRVAIIRSKGSFINYDSPDLGWGPFVREGLEIHNLAVYQKGMLIEPFCQLLAEKLRLCLGPHAEEAVKGTDRVPEPVFVE